MKVVILCGGQGTRIRGVDDDVPKPMLTIGNLPILFHLMRFYAAQGHKEFILCLGYKANVIKTFFMNHRTLSRNFTIDFGKGGELSFHDGVDEIDWKVTMVDTGAETMTGSRVKRIEPFIGDDEDFMLTYGDGLSNIDVSKLIAYHKSHGRTLTISGVRPPGRFGEVEYDAAGQIKEFNEKPQTSGGRISGGFFVCRRDLFARLDANRSDEVLEVGPMRALVADGEMMLYEHDDFWQCMDTYRDYSYLNGLYAQGNAPWEAFEKK